MPNKKKNISFKKKNKKGGRLNGPISVKVTQILGPEEIIGKKGVYKAKAKSVYKVSSNNIENKPYEYYELNHNGKTVHKTTETDVNILKELSNEIEEKEKNKAATKIQALARGSKQKKTLTELKQKLIERRKAEEEKAKELIVQKIKDYFKNENETETITEYINKDKDKDNTLSPEKKEDIDNPLSPEIKEDIKKLYSHFLLRYIRKSVLNGKYGNKLNEHDADKIKIIYDNEKNIIDTYLPVIKDLVENEKIKDFVNKMNSYEVVKEFSLNSYEEEEKYTLIENPNDDNYKKTEYKKLLDSLKVEGINIEKLKKPMMKGFDQKYKKLEKQRKNAEELLKQQRLEKQRENAKESQTSNDDRTVGLNNNISIINNNSLEITKEEEDDLKDFFRVRDGLTVYESLKNKVLSSVQKNQLINFLKKYVFISFQEPKIITQEKIDNNTELTTLYKKLLTKGKYAKEILNEYYPEGYKADEFALGGSRKPTKKQKRKGKLPKHLRNTRRRKSYHKKRQLKTKNTRTRKFKK